MFSVSDSMFLRVPGLCGCDFHRVISVTVSVPGVDGRVQRFETDREALSSVKGVESMSDFYALGGNTNILLDIMFLLSLAAGIAVPIGHFTLGRMLKEKMDRGEL